jgi:hypothetical protein
MAAIYETAYPSLKNNFTSNELKQNFTPTESALEKLFIC